MCKNRSYILYLSLYVFLFKMNYRQESQQLVHNYMKSNESDERFKQAVRQYIYGDQNKFKQYNPSLVDDLPPSVDYYRPTPQYNLPPMEHSWMGRDPESQERFRNKLRDLEREIRSRENTPHGSPEHGSPDLESVFSSPDRRLKHLERNYLK
jgi:hypothetical protein